jgi:tetratricopeptide (TPR) repeat protein
MTTTTAYPAAPRGSRYSGAWIALLLAIVIAATYANSLRSGFHLHDTYAIETNVRIRSLANVPSFFVLTPGAPKEHALRPLVLTTFALNHAVSGTEPWSYIAFNVLLHWLVVVLAFRIVRDHFWLGEMAVPLAAVVALLVAAHPLSTSTVNYVSARAALLTAVFYLGTFDATLRRRRLLAVGLLGLGLATDAVAATLPLAVLAHWLVARSQTAPTAPVHRDWRLFAVLCALTLLGLGYRMHAHSLAAPPASPFAAPAVLDDLAAAAGVRPARHIMTQWSAYLYYLRLFLWPNALVVDRFDYPIVTSFWEPQAWASLLALVVLGTLAWRARRRAPALTLAALWYAIALVAEPAVLPAAGPVNEPRAYLAMLGLSAAATTGLWTLGGVVARRLRAPAPWVFAVLATFVVTGLGAATVGRNETWRDDYTLWLDAVRKAPLNGRAWAHAGRAALAQGKYAEARTLLETGRRLAPCYAYTLMDLSVLEWRTGDPRASLRWAEESVRCNPDMALPHFHRGGALERIGRHDEALEAYRRTTELDPRHPSAWFRQGHLLEQRGDWVGAAAAYDRVIAIDPQLTDAGMAAGVIHHHHLGNPAAALERYRTVLAVKPDHYGARYQEAVALLASGAEDDAVRAWLAFVPLAQAAGDHATLEGAPPALRLAAAPR